MLFIRCLIIFLYFVCVFCFSNDDSRLIIRSISLQGNTNVSQTEINYIVRQKPKNFFFRSTEFDPRLIRIDALTLKNYYYSKGFLDAQIDESYQIEKLGNKKYVDIFYQINEGKRYYLSEVLVNGNYHLSKARIQELLQLNLKKPYDPIGLNDNLYKLENEYHELGKLFYSISVKDKISDSVSITLNINEGEFAFINNTIIRDIGNIDNSIVLRELSYRSGDLYKKSNIDKTSNRLRELGIFSMANLTPAKVIEADSLVDILVEIRRYKQREWNSSGGLEPIRFAQGAEPLPALGATFEWRNRAFLNTPKQFSIKFVAGVPFEDEEALRARGFARTPDILLTVPLGVLVDGGTVCVHWIDSKAMFGGSDVFERDHRSQLRSYVNRLGAGCVVYWFGFDSSIGDADILVLDGWPPPGELLWPDGTKIS